MVKVQGEYMETLYRVHLIDPPTFILCIHWPHLLLVDLCNKPTQHFVGNGGIVANTVANLGDEPIQWVHLY